MDYQPSDAATQRELDAPLPPHIKVEVQRILDAEARRLAAAGKLKPGT